MNAPALNKYLSMKLEQKRKEHPSFRLMEIDDNLFPKGMITLETEAQNSDNELKTMKEIVAESWGRKSKNHLMIEGEGGIGKTVTLLSIPDKFTPVPVPAIYIPLHELIKKEEPIEYYIKRWILNNNEDFYGQLLDLLDEPWNKRPQLMLLLDGFNEIAAENHQIISKDISQWSEYPGIQIVTSSRYDIHAYVALSYDYSTIKLQPLSNDTIENYLNSVGVSMPSNIAIKTLITIPLLLTLYVKTELVFRQRESASSCFKEVKKPGSIVWNYLQCELWRFGKEDEDAKNAIIAMEFVAPYMAWIMQQNSLFFLTQEQFNKFLEDAYMLLKNHFNKPVDFRFHIQDAIQKADRMPPLELIRSLLEKQLCLFVKDGAHYRLMYQQFRDALAAMHLINLSYMSESSLPHEWNIPIEHSVLQYVSDLISEDEATRLWEQNRRTVPAIDDATRNQLRLQGLLHNNDFSRLDFSGLDLSNISLYSYKYNKTTIKLPISPIRMVKTKLSEKTFSAEGPKDWVDSIAVTPNGKHVICGSRDGIVSIWDLKTGNLVRAMKEHYNWVRTVAVSPDGKYVISGSNDCTICICELETGKLLNTLKGHLRWVTAVAVTPDGKFIVSGSFDCTICIWSLETGECKMVLEGHENGVTSVAITPDGKRVISGSNDCTIRIWDLATGCLIGKPIKGHKDWVNAIAIAPDGKRIVSGSFDNTIRVWGLESGHQIGKTIEGHKDSVNAVTITTDCKCIVSGSDDKTIRVWDLETGVLIVKPIEGHKDSVTAVAVTPDGKRIVSGSGDQTIRVWDLETGMPMVMSNEEHDLLSFEGLDFSLADISDAELKETLRQNGAKV